MLAICIYINQPIDVGKSHSICFLKPIKINSKREALRKKKLDYICI